MKSITIDNHIIGPTRKPFIIAEIGQAHDGSLGMAHSYIDAAAKSGVDAIKFQTHFAHAESTFDEPFRVRFSMQDKTRYDYWKRMEFNKEHWAGLAVHAQEKGLVFLSSPFSLDAVQMLSKLGVPAWKIGSGEFWSKDLLACMMETGLPLIVSTGMSRWFEIEDIAEYLSQREYPFALLQCTSKYPTRYQDIGLNIIDEMTSRFSCPIGLSDHSGTVYPALAAMARGISIIEVHLTFTRDMFGPDTSSSLTPNELSTLVQARDAFYKMEKNPVDKDFMAESLVPVKEFFSKSLALKRKMIKGECVTAEDLCAKKPGTGIPVSQKDDIVGRKLTATVSPDRLLRWDDLK